MKDINYMNNILNNKTYFVVSDIHSFLLYLKSNLKKAGFNKKNKNHILIIDGDIFDRGPEAVELYSYIKSIPKSRRILIKGNHEELFFNLLNKELPGSFDYTNGTMGTFLQLVNLPEDKKAFIAEYGQLLADISFEKKNINTIKKELYMFFNYSDYVDTLNTKLDALAKSVEKKEKLLSTYNIKMKEIFIELKSKVQEHEITKWLASDEWKDYYELNNFIITHCFIPVTLTDFAVEKIKEQFPDLADIHLQNVRVPVESAYLREFLNWRSEATDRDFKASRWEAPHEYFNIGLFKTEIANGKTLVCGHWGTESIAEYFFNNQDSAIGLNEERRLSTNDIYATKNFIALDASTVISKQVNVLVITNSGKIYDQNKQEIKGVL